MESTGGRAGHASPYATAGGGFHLERAYGGAALAALLLEERFPGLGDDVVVREVRFQQHASVPVDDLVVAGNTATGTRELFLAVRSTPVLGPGDARTRRLFDGYLTMLREYEQDFETGRYRLGLAVSGHRGATGELRRLTDLARRQRSGSSFRAAVRAPKAVTSAMRRRLDVLDRIVGSVTGASAATSGDPDLTWKLLRVLRVLELRLEGDDAPDRTHWIGRLQTAGDDPARADDLWRRLTDLAADYAGSAGTVDRPGLHRTLAARIQVRASPADSGIQAQDLRMRLAPMRWFTGRAAVLHDIAHWLAAEDDRAMVVTGAPGSGKTAVLSLVAALGDPEHRPSVSHGGLPPDLAFDGTVDAALHVGTAPAISVIAAIAAVVNATVDSAAPMAEQVAAVVAAARRKARPVVIAIDGLDEAADPRTLTESVLRPLLDTSDGSVRVLLGTRRHLLPLLGDRQVTIDLDDASYVDPAGIRAHARRILLEASGDGPYRIGPEAIVARIIDAIGQAAGPSFLLARILAHSLAREESLPDPDDPEWQASLPRTAGEAMRQDLCTRLVGEESRARELLLPLAYTQGSGMPWEDIWLPLVNGLSENTHTEEGLRWLRREAGFYLAETIEGTRTTFRLFHAALAEDLLQARTPGADQGVIATTLLAQVPAGTDGTRDWPAAHPYIRTHLASHAAAAGAVDHLLDDVGYLLAADRARLLLALVAAETTAGRARAEAYRRAAHHLAAKPPTERASYLELAARRAGDDALADDLAPISALGPWSCQWARWSAETPHRIMAKYEDAGEVHLVRLAEDRSAVLSVGHDDFEATLDVHALDTGEALYPSWAFTSWNSRVVRQIGFTRFSDGTDAAVTLEQDDILARRRRLRAWEVAADRPLGLDLVSDLIEQFWLTELDGHPVAVVLYQDLSVRSWDARDGSAIGSPVVLDEMPASSVCARLAEGRSLLVTATEAGVMKSRDLSTGALIAESAVPHAGRLEHLQAVCRQDGRTVILSGGRRYTAIFLWDPLTAQSVGEPWVIGAGMGALSVLGRSAGSPTVLVGTEDGTIQAWDLDGGDEPRATLSGHPFPVTALAGGESADGGTIVVSAGQEGSVRVWNLAEGSTPQSSLTTSVDVLSMASGTTVDGTAILVTASTDGVVGLWEKQTGAPLQHRVREHRGPIWATTTIELHDRSAAPVTGGEDGMIVLRDSATGEALGKAGLAGPVFALTSGQFSSGSYLMAAGVDPMIHVWDVTAGKLVRRIRSRRFRQPNLRSAKGGRRIRRADVTAALATTVMPNGCEVLLSGSADGILRMWNPATGRRIGKPMINGLPRSRNRVEITVIACLRLPDGRCIAALGSEDEVLTFWDLERQRPIAELTEQGWIHTAAGIQLPNGRVGLVTGRDTVIVWDLSALPRTAAARTLPRWRDEPVSDDSVACLIHKVAEIDLDAPVNAVVVDDDSIIAGTAQGIVRLRLHLSGLSAIPVV